MRVTSWLFYVYRLIQSKFVFGDILILECFGYISNYNVIAEIIGV